MFKKTNKNMNRQKRHRRVRGKVMGTPERPRLNVYRSLKSIHTQIIDDVNGITLVAASGLEKEIKDQFKFTGNKEAAEAVGKLLAKKAQEKGIESVVFDRGGYIYHGRVKSLADGARAGGLKF
ncbi:MAG: 50S ribosomal protein L18 [Clostridiales bacterium]|nr:50S ribosomal protein L18 [Clostridiales bacterium]